MAIRRISELDLFGERDLSMFWKTDPNTEELVLDDLGLKQYDNEKLSVGLYLEVSSPLSGLRYYGTSPIGHWDVIGSDEATSYYLSKKIPGNLIRDLFGNNEIIDRILSGPINYVGSQNFGTPKLSATDSKDTYWYDNRNVIVKDGNSYQNRLCVMISSDFTNTVTFHPQAIFHSGIIGKSDSNHFLGLSCGTASYNWHGNSVTLQDFGRVFDLMVDGHAYINNLTVNEPIVGSCLSARWADLAENYESDNIYRPGTLVEFGGESEITIARNTVNAVVTSKPGVCLNGSAMKDNVGIALIGKVPVRVIGKIKKFDRIGLSEIPGVGKVVKSDEHHVGIALESSEANDEKLVECVVQLAI